MADFDFVELESDQAGWPARRHEFGQFRYINRDWIAYPAQPYCALSLHFLFNDMAQYQKSYWPNTYPNSQPLCMSFL